MLSNMVIAAWMIGSMTLLIVKRDEITSQYRDTMHSLDQYARMHHFDRRFRKRLLAQATLYFKNRQIADEEVLRNLPYSVKRKVWRRLYMPCLMQTSLMKGIRQQFVDALLTNSTVEIFSAGEEILSRGHTSSDLYLLVEGKIALLDAFSEDPNGNRSNKESDGNLSYHETASIADSEPGQSGLSGVKKLGPGHFINDVSFFTETPNVVTVRTLTVVKTLTLSQTAYRLIGDDHPGSVGKLLANLLRKVEEEAEEFGNGQLTLTKRMEVLRAGSCFDLDASRAKGFEEAGTEGIDIHKAAATIQARSVVVAAKDVIKMHLDKMKDDHTTRFLFAASRDCTATITLMCDQGFDADNSDYDHRTALMVASMKGNLDSVNKLLGCHADPNLADMHGTTALHEAVKNGHEVIMDVLMEKGGKLGLDEYQAASLLCKAVFDGDTMKLRRLLKAKIQVNATDYDKRAAVHIAAAEGNLIALKILVEFGADISMQDRWGSTAMDEGKRVKAQHVVDFLESQLKGE
jgi:CRP-like cAMP-binding protein